MTISVPSGQKLNIEGVGGDTYIDYFSGMRLVSDNKATQASMVEAGRKTVEQYSWAKCSEKTLNTYRKVLHEREGGNTKAMRAGARADSSGGAAQEIACAG